jgi:hypothetical protein
MSASSRLVSTAILLLGLVVNAQSSNSFESLADLLMGLERYSDGRYIRKENGKVVEVYLLGDFLTKSNLVLLAGSETLNEVRLQGSPMSREEVDCLAAVPHLTAVGLSCAWDRLEPGAFADLCNNKKLKKLLIGGVAPPEKEFNAITNLVNLTEVRISYCHTFTERQLLLMQKLPRLQSLYLYDTAISNVDTNVIKGCSALTNFVFKR